MSTSSSNSFNARKHCSSASERTDSRERDWSALAAAVLIIELPRVSFAKDSSNQGTKRLARSSATHPGVNSLSSMFSPLSHCERVSRFNHLGAGESALPEAAAHHGALARLASTLSSPLAPGF